MHRCKFRRLHCWLYCSRLVLVGARLCQPSSTHSAHIHIPRPVCTLSTPVSTCAQSPSPVTRRIDVSNPYINNALVTYLWGWKPLGAFSTLFAVISPNQDCVAKRPRLRIHLPSSPTMSLRSDDADSTKNRQVSLMPCKRQTKCEGVPTEPPPRPPPLCQGVQTCGEQPKPTW